MAEDCLPAQLIERLLTRKLPLKSYPPAAATLSRHSNIKHQVLLLPKGIVNAKLTVVAGLRPC
jgi:hypothetical protein